MPGHVHKRTHLTKSGKESVLYYAVVELPQIGGRRKQDWGTGFRRKKDAEAALVEKLSKINSGEVVARSDLTVADCLQRWLGVADALGVLDDDEFAWTAFPCLLSNSNDLIACRGPMPSGRWMYSATGAVSWGEFKTGLDHCGPDSWLLTPDWVARSCEVVKRGGYALVGDAVPPSGGTNSTSTGESASPRLADPGSLLAQFAPPTLRSKDECSSSTAVAGATSIEGRSYPCRNQFCPSCRDHRLDFVAAFYASKAPEVGFAGVLDRESWNGFRTAARRATADYFACDVSPRGSIAVLTSRVVPSWSTVAVDSWQWIKAVLVLSCGRIKATEPWLGHDAALRALEAERRPDRGDVDERVAEPIRGGIKGLVNAELQRAGVWRSDATEQELADAMHRVEKKLKSGDYPIAPPGSEDRDVSLERHGVQRKDYDNARLAAALRAQRMQQRDG